MSYGHTGSTHDSTAFERTKIARDHADILGPNEFIWADSAYPVRVVYSVHCGLTLIVLEQIETWMVAPYKKPERDLPDNEVFNNHVSMVRIRSEHAIGYLKGRFQSLKGLRVYINSAQAHKYATYWVLACVAAHSFAMQCEADERAADADIDEDPFIREGLSSDSSDSDRNVPVAAHAGRGQRLSAAKAKRESLKEHLFHALERRAERRRRRYRF